MNGWKTILLALPAVPAACPPVDAEPDSPPDAVAVAGLILPREAAARR